MIACRGPGKATGDVRCCDSTRLLHQSAEPLTESGA